MLLDWLQLPCAVPRPIEMLSALFETKVPPKALQHLHVLPPLNISWQERQVIIELLDDRLSEAGYCMHKKGVTI